MNKLKWYRNPELLKAAYDEYGSLDAAARAIGGVHKSTLALAWRDLGLHKLPRGPVPSPGNEEALKKLYKTVYGREST